MSDRRHYGDKTLLHCHCGAKHLTREARRGTPNGWEFWREFFDWFAPNKRVEKCHFCGRSLILVWGERAKP